MSFFKGCYRIGRRTARYSFGSLLGFLRGEEPPVDLAIYPAHFHINIVQNFRGGGVGRRLISTYLEQLRGIGVNGVYLHTTSHNETACHLYVKLGFQLLSSRPNRYWSRWFGYTVENRSYGLKLL
jgi:ribosomal protein S18 acetylase RimI-like enzyme